MKILETERLIIRHFKADDLDEMAALCADAETMRFVGDGRPLNKEQVRGWIERSLENYRQHGFGCSAVVLKDGERFAGYCGFVRPSLDEVAEAEIIYGFNREFWGQGFGHEAARAMLEYGFNHCRLKRIIATIDPANKASIRIVTKLGMKFQEERMDEHNLPELLFVCFHDG